MSTRFTRDDSWGEERGNPIVKAIFARSWFLIIPLIAVWWFEARRIDPQVKLVEEKIKAEQIEVEKVRSENLGKARKMGARISLLRAVGDTFNVRFAQLDDLMDSLRVLETTDRTEIAKLEVQAESLRMVISEAEGRSQRHSDRLMVLQARVDSLRNEIVQREDAIAELNNEITTDRDLADRILRPDAYRKNSALVTGEGDFPNRDALPKR